MRLLRLYIENFKGIRDPQTVSFNRDFTVLCGPNGYGKTTIYDAIELCFTMTIYRIVEEEKTCKLIHKTHNIEKPFYKNDPSKPTIIKLELENQDGKTLIICCIDNSNGLVKPASVYLERYRLVQFDQEIKSGELPKLSDGELLEFLKLEGCDLTKVFRLFNYLQQDENTYFLKKTEYEKKSELNFLFQTEKEKKNQDFLENTKKKFQGLKYIVDHKIEDLEERHQKSRENVSYKKIFQDQSFVFDEALLFKGCNMDDLENQKLELLDQANELLDFRARFSPHDFQNKAFSLRLKALSQDTDFLRAYVLRDFLKVVNFTKIDKRHHLVNDVQRQSAFILQKHLKNVQDYYNVNKEITKGLAFLALKDENKVFDFLPEFIEDDSLKNILASKQIIEDTLNENESIINELLTLRSQLKDSHLKIDGKFSDKSCPYCGYDWKDHNELVRKFEEKTRILQKSNLQKTKNLEKIKQKIRQDYVVPLREYFSKYLKSHSSYDERVLRLLNTLKGEPYSYNGFDEYSEFILDNLGDYEQVSLHIKSFQNKLLSKCEVTSDVFKIISELVPKDFSGETAFLEEQLLERKNELMYSSRKLVSLDILNNHVYLLRKKIDNYWQSLKYNPIKAEDSKNLYGLYFKKNPEVFENLSINSLKDKIAYIESRYLQENNRFLKVLKLRQQNLTKMIQHLERSIQIYSREIQTFKKETVERIQIPFFLYTAKILQNYQQGMGVFISTGNDGKTIRFQTDSDSHDDAAHHLSSGQLAVVSVAFTLAINKVYKVSDELRFLAIDDPVQEMDALNIHSFIALLKHDFVSDYQIIVSTHNDTDALYMKYQIEQMHPEVVELIDVQQQFFSVN